MPIVSLSKIREEKEFFVGMCGGVLVCASGFDRGGGVFGFSCLACIGFAPLRVFCTELQWFSASNSVQNTRNGLNRYNIPANRGLNRYDMPANRPQAGPARSKSVRSTRNARHGRPRAANRPPDGHFTSMMRPWGVAAADVDVSLPHRGRTPRWWAPRPVDLAANGSQ
jgi:hypothetical protein